MRNHVFAAVAVMSAVACNQPAAPRGLSSADGLTLGLVATRTQPQRGYADSVSVTLTNTTADSVSLSVGGCPILFYVANT